MSNQEEEESRLPIIEIDMPMPVDPPSEESNDPD
jgi:hypothetical protein